MEQTAQSRSACRGPWRALCIALFFSAVTGLVWAIVHFAGSGDHAHSASDGAQLFALTLGPIWAASIGSRSARSRRCTLFTRKPGASTAPDERPWHER